MFSNYVLKLYNYSQQSSDLRNANLLDMSHQVVQITFTIKDGKLPGGFHATDCIVLYCIFIFQRQHNNNYYIK